MSQRTTGTKREDLRQRVVLPELLDELEPTDPRAIRSRADLRRLNAWMGNASIAVRALSHAPLAAPPQRVVELGAGDGTFLLQVARRLSARWPGVEAVLVDRWHLIAPQTIDAFQQLGWRIRTVRADVLEWLRAEPKLPINVIVCNLFLHHFASPQLDALLAACAERTSFFLAGEPERSALALTATRLLWLIGCNEVTRYDARVSVRAGFRGRELSQFWPGQDGWRLNERRAGLFTHLFTAFRQNGA